MTVSRTNLSPVSEFAIELHRDEAEALHRQIETSIRERIRSGALPAGVALPPSRALASDLGVSRGVVVEAYAQLVAEGYLTSRRGGYTQVAPAPARPADPGPPADLRGRPLSRSRPPRWPRSRTRRVPRGRAPPARRSISATAVATSAPFPAPPGCDPCAASSPRLPTTAWATSTAAGAPELRSALAAYLNRVRGTNADPETILITSGYAQAVSLLMGVLAARGAATLAVEDPSASDDARPSAAALGLEVIGVPVSADGVQVDAVSELRADVLILTPSHQWPTGGVLSPRRGRRCSGGRSGPARWSSRTTTTPSTAMTARLSGPCRAWTPAGSPTPAPRARPWRRGSASAGWSLPRELVAPVAEAKLLADRGSPVLDQLTFADFLTRGEFDRHLRRMRPVYRSRRDALLAALAEHAPDLEPAGIAAGLHLVAWLPEDLDEGEVIEAAAGESVAVAGVAPYRIAPSPRGGLIFGYSNLSDRAIADGIARLGRAVAGLRRSATAGTTTGS